MLHLTELLKKHPELEEKLPDIRQELARCEQLVSESTKRTFARLKKEVDASQPSPGAPA